MNFSFRQKPSSKGQHNNKNQGHSGCPSLRVSYLPALLLVPLKLGGGGLQYQQLPLNLPWLVHGRQLGQLGVQGHKTMDIMSPLWNQDLA